MCDVRCVMCEPCVPRLTSYILRPESRVLRPTSYILRLTSYILRPVSRVLRLTPYILRPASYVLHLTSCVLHLTSCVPRLASYVLRPTSYVLRLASSVSYRPITKIQGRLSRVLRSSSKYLRHLLTDCVFNSAFTEVNPAAMQTRVAGWHTLQIESAMRRLR